MINRLQFASILPQFCFQFQLAPLLIGDIVGGVGEVFEPCCGDVCEGMVGRCRLDPSCSRVDRAWFRRLKLKSDETLLNFALNFHLRRYSMGEVVGALCGVAQGICSCIGDNV